MTIRHQVKMLKTVQAYDDLTGTRKLSPYMEGETYVMSDSLFCDLVNDGAVELVADDNFDAENRETKVVSDIEIGRGRGRKKKSA